MRVRMGVAPARRAPRDVAGSGTGKAVGQRTSHVAQAPGRRAGCHLPTERNCQCHASEERDAHR